MFSIEANAIKLHLQLLFWIHMYMCVLFRDLQKEAHNLAYYQQLKFVILKLDLRDVGLPENSLLSDYSRFSHIGEKKF